MVVASAAGPGCSSKPSLAERGQTSTQSGSSSGGGWSWITHLFYRVLSFWQWEGNSLSCCQQLEEYLETPLFCIVDRESIALLLARPKEALNIGCILNAPLKQQWNHFVTSIVFTCWWFCRTSCDFSSDCAFQKRSPIERKQKGIVMPFWVILLISDLQWERVCISFQVHNMQKLF